MVDVDGCGSSPGRSWLNPTTSVPPRLGVCASAWRGRRSVRTTTRTRRRIIEKLLSRDRKARASYQASRGILRAMEFFETVTTQRAMRRLKADPIPDAVLRQIMDAALCAPSGGNRQGWSFLVIRDAATRARLGELYRESWAELMKTPYYRGASTAPADSREGKMVA